MALSDGLRLSLTRSGMARVNGPFVYGGTNCTRGWNFANIFFSDSVKIMRFYDFARTSVS